MNAANSHSGSSGQRPRGVKVKCACGKVLVCRPGAVGKCPECGAAIKAPRGKRAAAKPASTAPKRVAIGGGVAGAVLVLAVVLHAVGSIRHAGEQDAIATSVEDQIAKAEGLVRERKFPEAKTAYEAARTAAQALDDDREFPELIAEALASDDIKFGTDPKYVHFEGQWITTQKRDEILAKRFEEAQLAKGLVKFEAKWMTPKDKARILDVRFQKEQLAKGLVKLDGKWITQAEHAKIQKARREQFDKAQQAKGLVKLQGKWVKPAQRDKVLGAGARRAREAAGLPSFSDFKTVYEPHNRRLAPENMAVKIFGGMKNNEKAAAVLDAMVNTKNDGGKAMRVFALVISSVPRQHAGRILDHMKVDSAVKGLNSIKNEWALDVLYYVSEITYDRLAPKLNALK